MSITDHVRTQQISLRSSQLPLASDAPRRELGGAGTPPRNSRGHLGRNRAHHALILRLTLCVRPPSTISGSKSSRGRATSGTVYPFQRTKKGDPKRKRRAVYVLFPPAHSCSRYGCYRCAACTLDNAIHTHKARCCAVRPCTPACRAPTGRAAHRAKASRWHLLLAARRAPAPGASALARHRARTTGTTRVASRAASRARARCRMCSKENMARATKHDAGPVCGLWHPRARVL